jgi:hypothetical protein
MNMKKYFPIVILLGLAGLYVWTFGPTVAMKEEIKSAEGLGMTVDQLKTFRADLKSRAIAQDAKGMADLLLPALKNQCKRLPVGDTDRPATEVCNLNLSAR